MNLQEKDIANHPVRGDVIRKALDNLDVMGLNVKDVLTDYFQKDGIILDGQHFYTLDDMKRELATLFGEAATQLLVHQIEAGIKAQFP